MSKESFKDFLKSDFNMLRISGIWIKTANQTKPSWYNYYSFIALALLFSFNLSIIIYMLEASTLVEFVSVGFAAAGLSMTPIQAILLFRNKDDLELLFEQIDDSIFQAKDLRELELVEKKLSSFRNIPRILKIATRSSLVMVIISPIFYDTEQGLVLPAWYPFDISSSPSYQIAYIHQTIGLIFTASGFLHLDLIMGTICTFIGLQCALLTNRLKEIGNNGKEKEKSLGSCIQHYWLIFRFNKIANKVFGFMIFWQLFLTTVNLCMTLFLFNLANPGTFEFYMYMSIICSTGNLLLFPCLFASEVTTHSEVISTAAYNCNWIDGSNSFKKDLMFFMFVTQKPLALNVGGILKISKTTFVSVARASVSYYTILNNLTQ